jgi:peptidylprolyl isomerase
MRRVLLAASRSLLVVAAVSRPGLAQSDTARVASATHGDPQRTVFAAELGVDLKAMRRLPSGVFVRDIESGRGATAAPGREVTVSYVAYLADGTEVERSNVAEAPVRFRVGEGEVIRGWDTGLRGMRVGGTRLIVVPARLAYGAAGKAGVPPHAVMVFVLALDGVR